MTDLRMHALAFAATGVVVSALPTIGAAATSLVDFQVMVPNPKPRGAIVIAVFNDPAAWAAEGKPFQAVTAKVENGVAVARLKAPPGRYAVVAFEDKNGDGKLDALPLGWPVEKVGYSGGVRPLVGRPPWDKADFPLIEGERTTVFVRPK